MEVVVPSSAISSIYGEDGGCLQQIREVHLVIKTSLGYSNLSFLVERICFWLNNLLYISNITHLIQFIISGIGQIHKTFCIDIQSQVDYLLFVL